MLLQNDYQYSQMLLQNDYQYSQMLLQNDYHYFQMLLQNDYLFLEHICKVPGVTTAGTFCVTFSASLGAFIGASRILGKTLNRSHSEITGLVSKII